MNTGPRTLEFDDLILAAYKTERILGRRLARSAGLSEWQALKLTLQRVAGAQGLPHLLAARGHMRQADAERRALKAQAQAAKLALKRAKNRAAPTAWLAWFDGSAHPNPGRLGLGALLTGPQSQRIEISQRAGYGNSSQAEYFALIALLEAAVRLQPAELVVYGDSQVVINDVNSITPSGAKGLATQRARVGALIAQLHCVTLQWIPRKKNAHADRLSQQAIASWDASTEVPSAQIGYFSAPAPL